MRGSEIVVMCESEYKIKYIFDTNFLMYVITVLRKKERKEGDAGIPINRKKDKCCVCMYVCVCVRARESVCDCESWPLYIYIYIIFIIINIIIIIIIIIIVFCYVNNYSYYYFLQDRTFVLLFFLAFPFRTST